MIRGALIVVEGCDRSGKTTQCKKLVNLLKNIDIPAEYMNFPDRRTPIGKLINDYLTKKEDFPDKAIHLLFSANRWETVHKIEKSLLQGTTVIIDRYAFSGVAFSAVKPGLDLEWCKQPDSGLPKPDLVLLLNLTPEAQRARGGFGAERYEKDEIQRKVIEIYKTLQDSSWKEIDADKSEEELTEELLSHITETVNESKLLPLGKLW
ncbi:uncharacterized protein LOC128983392 [Macrosteles quadrilineatus]|uniref:uncharacterized protein LOC128983392 n=1 Tax=Macrosteles quadrilineatus TaxID=74068 RepID=UPI0023E257E5|nr:uncharacterized protein LOC128983392 [Macrosteles quadrilineatus]XP_054258650.1 uncharacterized protein LOC128983392 [Macrosteles quadrilineatus]XP_054258658.1 uncharacterized protein LOC128983392 [Macrosteles quadrilineatus]